VTIRHLLLFVALLLLGGCTQPEPECITCQSEPLAPPPLEIIDRPIVFDASRIEMTKSYIQTHYHKRILRPLLHGSTLVNSSQIVPISPMPLLSMSLHTLWWHAMGRSTA